jgi:hypothetical protein
MAEHNYNPAVSAEQYRLAQAVLSGTVRTPTHMTKAVAREIVDRTPARLRSEYSRYTENPGGVEVELTKHHHFLPFSTKKAAETMKRLLVAEGVKAEVKRVCGVWGVDHTHANPFYGTDLDLETTMAPAWVYYDSKAARDQAARLYEGRGKKVVLGHSMFGFSEGGGKRWRLRGVDHRGNPGKPTIYEALVSKLGRVPTNAELKAEVERIKREAYEELAAKGGLPHQRKGRRNPGSFYQRTMYSNDRHEIGEIVKSPVYGPSQVTAVRETGDPEKYTYEYDITPVTKRERTRRSTRPYGPGPGKRYRGNPQPSADDMYASFHGEESDETIEIEGEEHYHSHVAALGELVELKVKLVVGGTAVIGFESGEDESDTVNNPFWSSARSTASKISGSVLSGLKRAAASRKERARWIPYATTDSEVRAQAKAGYLEAHDVSAKVEKRKVGGILSRKYKFDVMVDREQLREMFKRSAGEKRASRGSRAGGSKPAGAYKGYQIREVEGGFAVPKLDPTGVFTSKADAREFIDYSKMGAKVKNSKKRLGPVGSSLKAGSDVVDYLDSELGRAINPGPDSQSTGPVYLTSNEDGNQLYITGGDQSLDLPGLGITGPAAEKELVTIGSVTNICYHAHKIFDGKREEFDYVHKFSEDSHGPLPILTYDRINQHLKLSGGVYKIERPLIGTSPGIED